MSIFPAKVQQTIIKHEAVRLHYHSRAAKEGLYVTGSCGFNSVPADFGVLYTRDQFKGTLTSIESFLTISAGSEGYCINEGAWKSAICSFSNNTSLTSQSRKFGDGPLCVVGPRTGRRALFFSPEVEQYAVPFMGADMSVVRRTQRFLCETYQQTPVQYSAYIAVGRISNVVKMLFAAVFFWLMVKFSIGRTLLTVFPELFSFGLFSKSGPTRKQIEESSFCITFYGDGNTAGVDAAQSKPNAKICTQVKGPEPGYVATPIAMVQAAITLLNEHKSLPGTGGVYSPGAAFARTTLLRRLNKHGFKFSVVSSSVSGAHSLEQHDT